MTVFRACGCIALKRLKALTQGSHSSDGGGFHHLLQRYWIARTANEAIRIRQNRYT